MRVPTYIQYKNQLDILSRQYVKVDQLNTQINTGKKLITSADDPVLAQNIKSTQKYIAKLESYQKNTIALKNRTSVHETSMRSTLNVMGRVTELVKQARTDTMNEADRLSIAKELEGILNTVAGYANSTDSTGNYVFAGTRSNSTPFVKEGGVYQYVGSQEITHLPADQYSQIVYNENGHRVFGDILNGNGDFTIHQTSTANTGTARTTVGRVVDRAAYVEDDYTLTFVTNSGGQTAIQIVGATSGQVLPAPPATTPADAPEYIPNETINVNGIAFEISGAPVVGDQFEIKPSEKNSSLNTLQELINFLREPVNNDAEKANYHQELSQFEASINEVKAHFTNYLSEVGYRSLEVETISQGAEAEYLVQKQVLSQYEDADPYQLISEMTKQMTSLQITQQSYMKVKSFFEDLMRYAF